MTARHFGLRPARREEPQLGAGAIAACAAGSLVVAAVVLAIATGLAAALFGPPLAIVRLVAWF